MLSCKLLREVWLSQRVARLNTSRNALRAVVELVLAVAANFGGEDELKAAEVRVSASERVLLPGSDDRVHGTRTWSRGMLLSARPSTVSARVSP